MTRRRKSLFALVTVALLLLLAEGLAFVAARFLQTRGIVYRTPVVVDDYEAYMAGRHPVLGWPSPTVFGRGEWDAIGSRVIPAFPDPHAADALVSLYGDSFTWSSPVDAEHAWSNVLATRLDRRVNNFGVRGYGTDQCYLRFLGNEDDHAPVVILGHLSGDIIRNVNQSRYLLDAPHPQLKPRFVLEPDGTLRLVPLPEPSEAEYADVTRHPERYLVHEAFLPDGPNGAVRPSFPWLWTVLRSAVHYRIRARLAGRPLYVEFYDEDHPSGALQVTEAILSAFVAEARSRGREPLVVLIPAPIDLDYHRRRGVWTHQPLTDRLVARGLPVLDAGPEILRRLGDAPITDLGPIDGHFAAEGYRLLAEIVHDHLRERGLVE